MNNLRNKAALSVLLMVSLGHLLNDMFQAVIPAIYPMIKESLGLSFMQIGAITLKPDYLFFPTASVGHRHLFLTEY